MQYEAVRSLRIIRGLLAGNPDTKEQLQKVDEIIATLPASARKDLNLGGPVTDTDSVISAPSTNLENDPSQAVRNAEKESEYLLSLLQSLRQQDQAQLPKGTGASSKPAEALYCTCNRPATGNMVACDAEGCPYEWYHFECVELTGAPMGVWYCPYCREQFGGRRKRRR